MLGSQSELGLCPRTESGAGQQLGLESERPWPHLPLPVTPQVTEETFVNLSFLTYEVRVAPTGLAWRLSDRLSNADARPFAPVHTKRGNRS